MRDTRDACLLALLVAAGIGCVDRRGPDVHADAGWDLNQQSTNRYRSGGGCHLIPCTTKDVVQVVIVEFYGRFLSVSRSVDVEVCHAGVCNTTAVRDTPDGGPYQPPYPSTRNFETLVPIDPANANPATPVRVKIAIPSGRTLHEEQITPRADTYCPNGHDCPAPCPIWRAIFGSPTPTDAGWPPEQNQSVPFRDRTCTPP